MTLEELAEMLEKTGFPFAYDHFAEGESPDPPFICYLLPGSVILRQTDGYTSGSVK